MSDTIKLNNCPKCGAPIPDGAPQGLCPKCILLGAATATEAGVPATATSEIPSLARVATAFPQLEILELIGRGGMGFVFKARQPHLDRFVALKLLPDKLARDPRFTERFNREGRVLAKLNHPNIVSVYDFGQTEHFYFLTMEFVDGVNLRQAMKAGRFSPGEALAIVPKICEALQYAHGQGILHRDIKPENILLDARGQVKIADFGIAKLVGDDKPDVALTATGAALGTPHYMAPEQLEKPLTVDHRADIYSLGVVFYEMLTGELPIGRFAAPSSKTPVGANVDEVVFRTLEKDRERRYQSAGEMKTQVEHLTEAGAGNFQAPPPKLPGAETVVPKWSQKAIWGAVLTGLSLPLPLVLLTQAYLAKGGRTMFGVVELVIFAGMTFLPGLAGTILGWTALSDIRAQQGRLRGLPLAVPAALAWPLAVVVCGTLVWPLYMLRSSSSVRVSPTFAALLPFLILAGAVTFAIWAVYAAAHWGGNKPASPRHSLLKWVLTSLFIGALFGPSLLRLAYRPAPPEAASPAAQVGPVKPANAAPWIRFTITGVEVVKAQSENGGPFRTWLGIDYQNEVHGAADKAFSWGSNPPGVKTNLQTGERIKDSQGPVTGRYLVQYLLPPATADGLKEYELRDRVRQTLEHQTFELALGEEKILFEIPDPTGGLLKARIKVVPPLKGGPDAKPAVETTQRVDSPRKLELGVPTIKTDSYGSVMVTTDSELPVGDYVVGLLRRPDGRMEELPASTTVYAGAGRTRVLRHLLWPMNQFETNRVRDISAGMRASLDGRVVELVPDRPVPVFQATNDRGGVTEGFIALRRQSRPTADLPPVSISVVEVSPHWGPYFLTAKLRISAPMGYMPNAVGVLGDGSELETHTSMTGAAGVDAGCYWYYPREFVAADIKEITRQLEAIKVASPNGIRIPPGERVPMFSVTNQAGIIFRGYFELPMTSGAK